MIAGLSRLASPYGASKSAQSWSQDGGQTSYGNQRASVYQETRGQADGFCDRTKFKVADRTKTQGEDPNAHRATAKLIADAKLEHALREDVAGGSANGREKHGRQDGHEG